MSRAISPARFVPILFLLACLSYAGGASLQAADAPSRNAAAGRPYTFLQEPSGAYPDPDGRRLTDGARGARDDPGGGWVGFDRGQPSVTLDLGEVHRIADVRAGFMTFAHKGVRPPTSVRISTSVDGRHWILRAAALTPAGGAVRYDATTEGKEVRARYVRLAPERREWLLMDEVEVAGMPAPGTTGEQRPVRAVALVTDAAEVYDASVDRLRNLLDGMGLPYDLLAPTQVAGADLTRYQLVVVAPSSGGRFEVDEAFERSLVQSALDGVALLWIGRGIWGSFRTTQIPEIFGLRYVEQRWAADLGIAAAPFTNLGGEAEQVTVLREIVSRVEATRASVPAWYRDAAGRDTRVPFVTEHRPAGAAGARAVFVSLPLLDHWKSAEAPDTYARAEIAYAQILRLLGEGAVGKHPVRDAKEGVLTLRVEDYTPGGSEMGHAQRTWTIRMRRLLETARTQGLPVNIALVPRYAHPAKNEYHDWASDDPGVATLRRHVERALADGGALIVHGYKHQNGSAPDDYSGDDYEMWDEDAKAFLPLAEQRRITDQAYSEVVARWSIRPKIWETPHYEGNADTYRAAASSGFVYVNESDTTLFPNRQGYLGRLGGLLLNVPETGFNIPLELDEIRSSNLIKQQHLLPRLVRLRAPFNFFYHNLSVVQERALRNLLTTAGRFDLWKPNLEELAGFWERRERVRVAARLDPYAGRLIAEVSDAFPGLALSVRLPDGASPKSVTVDGRPVATAAVRQVGEAWLVEPVLSEAGTRRVVVDYVGASETGMTAR